MKKTIIIFVSFLLCSSLSLFPAKTKNKAKFMPKEKDTFFAPAKDKIKEIQEARDKKTAQILDEHAKQEEKKEERERQFKSDMAGIFPPKSPKEFKSHFHFPPISQFYSNTCWSFSTTSFYESEIFRLTGKKIKLSEIYTVYFEHIEKCRRYIRKRGESYVAEGGEPNALQRLWKQYGIVPAEAYSGLKAPWTNYVHIPMMAEIKGYLEYVKTNNLWNEKENLKHIELILQKHIGKPPVSFTYNGKTMTPQEFLKNETGLNMDDYYSTLSTSAHPFYTQAAFRSPDNWWFNDQYVNLPLEVWYKIIIEAVKAGHTMVIGGDMSEPGKLPRHDVCFIPTFDIPEAYINQDARELRMENESTGDDHTLHLVGYKRYKGKDWFLIKDSGRSGRMGEHVGYYFFRGDFVKLKMMLYHVHKDVLKEVLPRVLKKK